MVYDRKPTASVQTGQPLRVDLDKQPLLNISKTLKQTTPRPCTPMDQSAQTGQHRDATAPHGSNKAATMLQDTTQDSFRAVAGRGLGLAETAGTDGDVKV